MTELKLTKERLRSVLDYDPDTGVFTWKSRRRNNRSGSVAGTLINNGYLSIKIDQKAHSAHRLAFLYMGEDAPPCVDHINGIKSDNRWSNLRTATPSQNSMNRNTPSTNTSGVKGACWIKRYKRWRACLRIDRKTIHVGYFPDLIGAELAIRKARSKLHGEYANHG